MNKKEIPIAGPWVTDLEIQYTADAAKNSWYERASEWNIRFEKTFAKYIGSEYAISLPHCTSAIHLALCALGVGPGDEVIVPDTTWIASVAPVKYVGAQPVFADIEKETWCISPQSIENLITPKTKAVIPVDLYGSMPNYEIINSLSSKYNFHVIEDAAEAFGSELNKIKAGKFGCVGTYSFHGSKTITTGEGGMLVTDNSSINQRVLFLRDHGRSPGDRYFQNSEVAYKYRMSSLQAAFGTAQLERADQLVEKKRKIYNWYKERLSDFYALKLNSEPNNVKNSYWMTTIIFNEELDLKKEQLMGLLLEHGIQSRPFFNQLSKLPAFSSDPQALKAQKLNKESDNISKRGINLPSALSLEEEDIDYVCSTLKKIINSHLN